MRKITTGMPSRKKAAIVLAVIGQDLASELIKHFSEDQIETLSLEMARLEKVSSDARNAIVEEFHELAMAQDFIAEGGVEAAKKLLNKAFGEEKADHMIKKIVNAMQVVPFEFLKRADPQQLLTFIQHEHPQTIALVLAYMPMSQASLILSKLPTDLRVEVAERIALMEQCPPEVIREVESVFERKVSNVISQDLTQAGGTKSLVDLLNRVDRSTERLILEALTESNPELAEEIKNMMFVFEDIVTLEDRAVQTVLKEVEVKELATALKGTGRDVQDKIFANMSERATDMLKEDMEYMGPMKVRVVEEAQQKVVAVIRRLEEAGEIMIGRGEEEVLV
ncbi:MAG: flagellar motor switch protein FliG [Armatimonadetes bacterium]|nr:flagellar motor switch protein FliG [Armatimonadota bacterium]